MLRAYRTPYWPKVIFVRNCPQNRRARLARDFSTGCACISHAYDALGACIVITSVLHSYTDRTLGEENSASRWEAWQSMIKIRSGFRLCLTVVLVSLLYFVTSKASRMPPHPVRRALANASLNAIPHLAAPPSWVFFRSDPRFLWLRQLAWPLVDT